MIQLTCKYEILITQYHDDDGGDVECLTKQNKRKQQFLAYDTIMLVLALSPLHVIDILYFNNVERKGGVSN